MPDHTAHDRLAEWSSHVPAIDLLDVIAMLPFASVSLSNENGHLEYVDEGTAERFGMLASDLIGKRINDMVPTAMQPERNRHRDEALRLAGQWIVALDMFQGKQIWHLTRRVNRDGASGLLTVSVTPPPSATLPPLPRLMYEYVSDPGPLSTLTLGEAELLRLLALSQSQDEIADTLSRSVKAIERRRTLLGKKLNSTSRTELALIGAEAGLHRLSDDELERISKHSFSNAHPLAERRPAAGKTGA